MREESRAHHVQALQEVALQDVGALHWNEPLSRHSSWRIGGPADLLVEPESVHQVQRLFRSAAACSLPVVVLGQGSNVLFSDAGIRGIVMKFGGRFSSLSVQGNRIVCQAGVWLPRLARSAGQAGIGGLEHVVGIPGTLGGLVFMNGGSQRKSIGSSVRRIWAVTPQGEEISLSREQCQFSYRTSRFQQGEGAVVRVELEGNPVLPAASRREMLETLRSRRRKFPLKQPNCGSVFLCDEALYASLGPPGKLVEDAGLKGRRVGGAQVSLKHGNFIVNLGGASSLDVIELIKEVRREIGCKFSVQLGCEVRFIDEQGRLTHGVFS